MSLLKWNESYSTGIDKMDEQHKKWMELINRFYDDLKSTGFKENTKQLLDDAIEYTAYHFSQEEELMRRMGYPNINEQKQEHARIKEKLVTYKHSFEDGSLNVSQPVTNELKSWFNKHVTEMDKEYGSFITK